jgi:tetratricopeptide (TPR) repeat protein
MPGSRLFRGSLRSPVLILPLATLFLLWLAPRSAAASAGAQEQQPGASPAKEKKAAARLEPSKPVEKELAGGASDSYEIQVGAGQFVHAMVDQLGIDVALTLYGPDEKQIAMMDSPNGFYGQEQISTVAEAEGIYRLEIASGDKNVAPGRYRVSINALRPPTDDDRSRIKAERLFTEAGQLYVQGGADSLRQAAQKYGETLPLWHGLADAYEEGLALNAIGDIHQSFGENQKALEYYNKSLPLRRAAGDRDGAAWTLNSVGVVYDQFGEKQKSARLLQPGAPASARRGQPERASGDAEQRRSGL